jgi:predicted Fe-Mo cluster-binding NifX family protein
MKIAISATDNTKSAMVDPRFGRTSWLLIVDTNTGDLIEAIDNSQGREAAHGAGISAAVLVVDKGVEAVLTGRVGPKALPILEKAGIKIVTGVEGNVQEAVARYAGITSELISPEFSNNQVETAPPTAGGAQGQGQGRGLGQGGGQGQGQGQGRGLGQGGGQGQGQGQGRGLGQGRGQCRKK